MASLLAALLLGRPYVPLDPGLGAPPGRLRALLAHSGATLALCEEATRAAARQACAPAAGESGPTFRAGVLDVGLVLARAAGAAELEDGSARGDGAAAEDDERPLHVIYTSGSTGRPKAVVGRRAATLNRLRWQWRTWPWAASDVACARTPHGFVDHVAEVFGALLAPSGGGHPPHSPVLVCPKGAARRDVEELLRCVAERGVTRLLLTPTLLRAVLHGPEGPDGARRALGTLRAVTSSGEMLPCALLRDFFSVAPASAVLLNVYGSTEVSADATCAAYDAAGAAGLPAERGAGGLPSAVPCGTAIDGVTVRLGALSLASVADREEDSNRGGVGEVLIGGACLAAGYHRDADATARAFPTVDGRRVFRSGDVARWVDLPGRAGASLQILGRCDQMVKVRGQRVELCEVEAALQADGALAEAGSKLP